MKNIFYLLAIICAFLVGCRKEEKRQAPAATIFISYRNESNDTIYVESDLHKRFVGSRDIILLPYGADDMSVDSSHIRIRVRNSRGVYYKDYDSYHKTPFYVSYTASPEKKDTLLKSYGYYESVKLEKMKDGLYAVKLVFPGLDDSAYKDANFAMTFDFSYDGNYAVGMIDGVEFRIQSCCIDMSTGKHTRIELHNGFMIYHPKMRVTKTPSSSVMNVSGTPDEVRKMFGVISSFMNRMDYAKIDKKSLSNLKKELEKRGMM